MLTSNIKKLRPTPKNLIKIALAILLVLCLFHMPYGYYQLFRFIAVVGFAILAYYEYERKNIPLVIVFVALALLFQPLAKVPLGRQAWIMIDVVVASGLVVSVFVKKKKG
jgi:hypothetical protein